MLLLKCPANVHAVHGIRFSSSRISLIWLGAALLASETAWGAAASGLNVADLRSEYRINPIGLDVPHPRLSWTLQSDQRDQRQTAYQILVASSTEFLGEEKGDLWDSGKQDSDHAVGIAYAGKPLGSRSRACWKVRVWDKDGRPSQWSPAAHWTMGLLNASDWQAHWIGDGASSSNSAAGPLNGYHSALVGSAETLQWVAVDLGRTRTFDAVRLFPARPYDWQPDTPGFLFPMRFKIEVSEQPDFSDARTLLDRSLADEPNPGTNAAIYRFAEAQGRFVRLLVTTLSKRDATNFAFALAELQVLAAETNLAKLANVIALNSVETGPWAKANLTDGVLITVPPGGAGSALPAVMLRRSFNVAQPVRRATAYITALGLYEARLNGHRIGDQLLPPEWTSYRKRIQYQTYDVTGLVQPGTNVAAAVLGEGWYAGRLMAVGRFVYGKVPELLFQLEIELADGSRQVVTTDGSWRSTSDGPIRSAGIYDGETFAANRYIRDWDVAGFDDHAWAPVQTADLDSRQLVWQRNEPISVEQELPALKLTEPKPGTYIFDFGQNLVGWCRVTAKAARDTTVVLRHGEMLKEDGTLYTANLRGAPQVDRFIPVTNGEFTFEPHFTYHGFRYLEITGLSARPATNSVVAQVFHSGAAFVGRFECSDASLNRLMSNVQWTERANLMSSPNDCPQRDERFGWMGDIQAFAQTAVFNMDLAPFFSKWTQDIRDDQADDGRFPDFAPHPGNPNAQFSGVPAWGDAGVFVPWCAYVNYDDTGILRESFEPARRWVEYIRQLNPDLIWAKGRNNDYNDWLNGDWVKQAGWPTQGGSVPHDLFATAFFAHSTELVSKMAELIGRYDEAVRYRELFERIKAAFNQKFVHADGHIEGDTQAGYALALHFNLLSDQLRPGVAELLASNIHKYHDHLSTGIQTTHRALLELTRSGHNDLAWQLLTNRTFPSWLYMINNGATTIWERWDGYVKGRGFQDPGMNSFNHWAFGAVGEWMWRNIAGLNPDEDHPGWKHFRIEPRPGGGVSWANATYNSVRGRIETYWKLDGSRFDLEVLVPANTTATVVLPAADAASLRENGRRLSGATGVRQSAFAAGRITVELQSGRYQFTSIVPVP